MELDLAPEMAALADRLGRPGPSGRAVQFVAVKAGAGASTIARAFALEAARTCARGVWLVELDVMKGDQFSAFAQERAQFGALSGPVRSSPGQEMFFTVSPKSRGVDGRPFSDVAYLAAHTVGASKLWVTRFRREALTPGQSVQILRDGAYWDALRRHADYVVIDAPAADRSPASLAAAPFMDANLIVLSAQVRLDAEAAALRDDLLAAGGPCNGVVLTRAPERPPAILRSLFP